MGRDVSIFQLQHLEQRVLLSSPEVATLAEPTLSSTPIMALAAPSDVLTKASRQELLHHWNGINRADLQARLDANKLGAFDGTLLDYMKGRGGNTFFWNTADVAATKNFINTKLATATTIANADHIVAHRFPNGNSASYTVQLPAGDIDWNTTTSNGEFVHKLNRHDFWIDLAQAYVLTGQAKYINELIAQLSSWSKQNSAPADPNKWADSGKQGWQPLSAAIRAGNWTWAYQMVLGSAGWTPAANTLFLYKLHQHGEFLRHVARYPLISNRALTQGEGLMSIAHLVPELDGAPQRKSYARGLLFDAMDAQLNPDGGHAESSPGYASIVLQSLLEMYWLDRKKGEAAAWSQQRVDKLHNATTAHTQLLTPDAKVAAWSDTYRGPTGPFWNRARVILDDKNYPSARPRLRDAWLFGAKVADELWDSPVNPALKDRGATYSMPQSGYYVMRSGADASARQITFDAGPTGGAHGHFDLLSFELFGFGKPLISDPGLYTYEESARRRWAVGTQAHNTIDINGANHAAVEGVDNPDLWSSGISEVAGGYQITARHLGYKHLTGLPVVSRSIWFDGDGVMLIVDRGESTASHTFSTSFLLPGTSTTRDLGKGWIRTNHTSGNVKIQSLLQSGQTAHRQNQITTGGPNVFTSDDPDAGLARDATRYNISQTGAFAQFVTLITTYSGKTEPNISAQIVGTANGSVQVQINRNGKAAELIPFFARPAGDFRGSAPIAGGNDIAFDAGGRLHLVYNDRAEKNLKYAVRDAKGKWSFIQTVDDGFEAGGWPSLALDNAGNPMVAYFDGGGGDLKFARLLGGAWQVEAVDTAGSTGLYPSMVAARDGAAMMAYYNRTRGDLRLAMQSKGGWKIVTLDSEGDVGRGASATLDPNVPRENRLAIAYDAGGGMKKFALQTDAGWSFSIVDNTTPRGGGSTSLVYEPFLDRDKRYHATMSYYDSANSALKFARFNGQSWDHTFVATQGVQGVYTSLYYDAANYANILYFRKTNLTAQRAHGRLGSWTIRHLGSGGREMQNARGLDGTLAYTNLDADGLRIELLAP